MITTHENGFIRRRSSPQVVWELASEQERQRLVALPRPDLLAAIKANAIVDLTEADQVLVLECLYSVEAQGALTPAVSALTGLRKPLLLAGKSLPCGPRTPQNYRLRLTIILAIAAPVAWAIVLFLGYALAQGA